MTVAIHVGSIADEIGAPDFLHAFLSTVSVRCDSAALVHLEPDGERLVAYLERRTPWDS